MVTKIMRSTEMLSDMSRKKNSFMQRGKIIEVYSSPLIPLRFINWDIFNRNMAQKMFLFFFRYVL